MDSRQTESKQFTIRFGYACCLENGHEKYRNWQNNNQNWTQRERAQRHVTSFQTTILVMMNNARRKSEIRRTSAMRCKVTTPANPNGSSWARLCASGWSVIETKRLNSSCSKQDHENIIIESQRIRTTKSKE